ncbi:MAG: DUF3472 domain-containing protein [Odoribacteraceae bacterium]|nr:DUF3472 domain-containing protein [Odoribacteraceae bacterium]
MNTNIFLYLLAVTCLVASPRPAAARVAAGEDTTAFVTIPVHANAYTGATRDRRVLDPREGTARWTDDATVYSIYFNARGAGELRLALRGCSGGGKGQPNALRVTVSVNGEQALARDFLYDKESVDTDTLALPPVSLPVVRQGHAGNTVRVDLQALGTRRGAYYFRFPALLAGGEATLAGVNFVPPSNAHFGRRGPSVHLRPAMPVADVEYFYTEVFVPVGQDVVGSFFMCNGFGEGYAGIQVNSATERRVLFSVWSAYRVDNPALMGKYAPRLTRVNNRPGQREHITYTKFGGEGSGGQSFARYAWEAGKVYRMLTRVRPHPRQDLFPGSTLYKAWFHDGDEWVFIAEWRRVELDADDNHGIPPAPRRYAGAHHFLENFTPATGNVTRRGTWDNQWFISKEGEYFEATAFTFTNDATAAAGHRVDHAGGVVPAGDTLSGAVFLETGGYFTGNVPSGTRFTKPARGKRPALDLDALNAMGTDDPAVDPVLDAGERY